MRYPSNLARLTIGLLAIAVVIFIGGCGATSGTGDMSAKSTGSETTSASSEGFADVSIGTTPLRAISPTFMGLSNEWGTSQAMMGDSVSGVNEAYRQLIRNLMTYGSGPIILRIGGNSTDESGEPTSTTIRPFVELANALDVHFYLGVNLAAGNVNLAMDQAKDYINQMPKGSIDAIEIGNEPDQYPQKGYRKAPYTFENYLAEFNIWKENIFPLLSGSTKLMGASWASPTMLSNIGPYDAAEASALATFSAHYYVANGLLNNPPDTLLTPIAATAGPKAVEAAVATSQQYHLPFRMGEMNSLYNGGGEGISDAFGSALWAIDSMFEYVNIGVAGVNWQVGSDPSNPYNPFSITAKQTADVASYTTTVNPLYYGLLFFQAATGNKCHLLPVTLNTHANLKAWATIDNSGVIRLVLINKDENESGSVNIALGAYGHARIFRLTAPNYQSKTGISFAGQTFDDSNDGFIHGNQAVEDIDTTGGSFSISMPVISAALMIFTK